MNVLFPWLAWLAVAVTGDLDQGVFMVQMHATNVARSGQRPKPPKPWEVHKYLICTHHKSGVDLTKKLVWSIFGELGVFHNIEEDRNFGMWNVPCLPEFCFNPQAPVLIEADMCSTETVEWRREAAGQGAFRLVVTSRDPLDMVASAYCFHHAWKEAYNPISWPLGLLPSMGPEEGVALMAKRMLTQVANMTGLASESRNDTFRISYEKFTRSSQDFDAEVQKLADFWFDGLITEEEHGRVLEAAKHADFRRFPDPDHASDKECVARAREAAEAMPAELLSQYRAFQSRLGYSHRRGHPVS